MLSLLLAALLTSPCPPPPPKPVCRMSKVSCARLQQLIEETEYLGTWDPVYLDAPATPNVSVNNYYNTMGGN